MIGRCLCDFGLDRKTNVIGNEPSPVFDHLERFFPTKPASGPGNTASLAPPLCRSVQGLDVRTMRWYSHYLHSIYMMIDSCFDEEATGLEIFRGEHVLLFMSMR